MAELTKRQKWIGLALIALLFVVAFIVDRVFGGPSPEAARAALAEKNLCARDAAISRHDGKVVVGNWECDLPGRRFRCDNGSGEFAYESSSAGSRWVVSRWSVTGSRISR